MQRAYAPRGLRFLPKLTLAITAGLAISAASYATDVFTDPVGFISLTAVPSGYSFWGLAMTPLVALPGTVGTPVGTKIPVNSTLTANQFTRGAVGGAVAYFIEITSGPNAGLEDDIVSNDTANVFTATDDSALVSNGQTFKIYPHWTPDTAIGSPAQSGLVGSSGGSSADNVIVWDPVHQTPVTYFYRTNTNGAGPGWRGPQGATTPAGTNVWYLDQGIQVLRRTGTTNLVTKLVGGVKLGTTVVPMAPGPNGYTYAAYVYATSVTMDGTGLFTGNNATGVQGSSGGSTADNVIIWDAAAQTPVTYFYRTNTNGAGPGWRGPQGATVPAGTNSIALGSIFEVYRRTLGGFNWTPVQPY